MGAEFPTRIFADRVSSVAVANGAVRISLVAYSASNELEPVAQLVIPIKGFAQVLEDLNRAADAFVEHRQQAKPSAKPQDVQG
jgi:hypothetical protein